MFYTVFSTNDSPYMQWQSDLLEYSWKRVGQEGVLIRLVATQTPEYLPQQRYAHCFSTSSWDVDPETGDFYPVYNKPASLLEWVYRDKPEGTVLLLDPDCAFRKPITQRVVPGHPISQKWVDFVHHPANVDAPFGLGPGFTFLNDHCVRTDLSIAPVMIPTLIHTSDLRRICARWLELCRIVHAHYRNVWESDMYAYLAVCAEYSLRHEPTSLGICTNWRPNQAPDAPIIHYCNPVCDKNKTEIFFKQTYRPWTWIESEGAPADDYGRDLIVLINDLVGATLGYMPTPRPDSRPKRNDGVMEGRVIDEILLEIPPDGRSLWLNKSGKAIWELCDGSRSITDIGHELCRKFKGDFATVTADAVRVVSQLRVAGFLHFKSSMTATTRDTAGRRAKRSTGSVATSADRAFSVKAEAGGRDAKGRALARRRRGKTDH